ncbi:hypothetical protein [Methylophilus sp.]|uniref:hypothetical protein n=1 Tax=Methylophilus sp. TaxID=29541 RepID=UPI000D4A2A70|nr:hypothetical protein [Methylophilus sp.]PPD12158.1 MAG: hypothetical protein CTY26_06090 [Methylophilus sp.]
MLTRQPQQSFNSQYARLTASRIWYPLHGDANAKITGQPNLDNTTTAAGNWSVPGYYIYPTANATDVWNSGSSAELDAVLSMANMKAGDQWIIAHTQLTPHMTSTGFLWTYGNDGSAESYIALGQTISETLQVTFRGVGATSAQAGVNQHNFSGMEAIPSPGNVRTDIVLSIEAQSATEVLARIMYRSDGGTLKDTGYSPLLNVRGNAATANPGRYSANHAGLTLGGRPTTGWTPANRLIAGNYGSRYGNAGSGRGLGSFRAGKYAFDSARQLAVINEIFAKKFEFPEAML